MFGDLSRFIRAFFIDFHIKKGTLPIPKGDSSGISSKKSPTTISKLATFLEEICVSFYVEITSDKSVPQF